MIEMTPQAERPRERCLDKGALSLSLRECIALILGSGPRGIGCLGLAARILKRPGEGYEEQEEERAFFTALENSGNAYLKEISGLGPAGQAKILAAFELGRRYFLFRNLEKQKNVFPSSFPEFAQMALKRIYQKQRSESQEWFGFVAIHRSGKVGQLCMVEKGARTHVNVDPAELFARLLALRPKGFILFHNHPSGIPTPSEADLDLTQKIKELSQQLGIELLGHWIVTSETEYWIRSTQLFLSDKVPL